MIEPRQVWAIFKDGTLVSLRFALAARASEVDEAQVPSYARASWRRAALDPHEESDPSYVAIPTQWRRTPMFCAAGEQHGARLVGRTVEVNGLRFHMDDRGRPRPGAGEPNAPDPEIVDPSELVAAAERAGKPLDLVERGTLRRVRVLPERPTGLARDEDAAREDEDVILPAVSGRGAVRIQARKAAK